MGSGADVKSEENSQSGETGGYAAFMWAWLDYETMEFRHVYKSELQTRMCSPDHFKHAEKHFQGKVFKVKIQAG